MKRIVNCASYQDEAIMRVNEIYAQAVERMEVQFGEEYTKEWLSENGFATAKDLSSKVKCVFTGEKAPVYVVLQAANGTTLASGGRVKYCAPWVVPYPIWNYNHSEPDWVYGKLFLMRELEELNELFRGLIYPYHSVSGSHLNHKGRLTKDGVILGFEPEINLLDGIIEYNGVKLNKQGCLATFLLKIAAYEPQLTADCTVDIEILIRPASTLNGFKDAFCAMHRLFDMRSAFGSHIHVSKLLPDGTLAWAVYSDEHFKNVAKAIFEKFIAYISNQPEAVKAVFGRFFGEWNGAFVGINNHGSGFNITHNRIEVRLAQYNDELQYLRVAQLVSDFANAFDEALKNTKSIDKAYNKIVRIWEKAVKKETATDRNASILPNMEGTRTRNART